MASWVAAIVKMTDGAWTKLRAHHVESTSSAISPWVLVDGRHRFGSIEEFGEAVARDLGADVIAISAQTGADAYGIWLTGEDLLRYDTAKKTGDSRSILDLLHPSSLAPFERVCRHFDLEAHKPTAVWNPPKLGFFAKLLGR